MNDDHNRPEPPARIWPNLRTKVEGGYTYERLSLRNANGQTDLVTPYVPAVGDLIHLTSHEKGHGTYIVVQRAWGHSSFGSADWPYGQLRPTSGPIVDLIVEAAVGPFVDEVVVSDEDDEEAPDGDA